AAAGGGNAYGSSPSLACAIGTTPAATAAAAPPLEPPAVRRVSHGLRVGPNMTGSVVGLYAVSGVEVVPNVTRPALRNRFINSVSLVATWPSSIRLPRR